MNFCKILRKTFSKFNNTKVQKKIYTEPLIEGQYKKTPALPVPPHIVRPEYVYAQNPVYGIYEGKPTYHDEETQQKLKNAGKLAGQCAQYAQTLVREGITTDEIDAKIHEFIISHNAYPTPIGFMGFPKSVCATLNEACCHGIPDQRPLKNGDYLNLDITLYLDGVHGDTSVMCLVGDVHEDIQKLINVTQQTVYECIKACKPNQKFSVIGDICEQMANEHSYHSCELFTGHGVGHLLHMPPMVSHNYNQNPYRMQPGSVFTIEPILMMYKPKQNYINWNDDFTILSPNNPSAQWEHTILITQTGYEIITKRDNEIINF